MNLQPIKPNAHDTGRDDRVQCSAPQHNGSRWFPVSEGFADLDGKPFVAYYCADCARGPAKEGV